MIVAVKNMQEGQQKINICGRANEMMLRGNFGGFRFARVYDNELTAPRLDML